jgi:cell cycle protein kinase DBF2
MYAAKGFALFMQLEMVKNEVYEAQTTSQRFNTYQTQKKESRAFSLVGSPDYMAPEVLTKTELGYSFAADYWSLGCILFELLCGINIFNQGYPPFAASTTNGVWKNLYNWEKVLERPVYEGVDEEFNLSDESWDLITRLL